MKKIVMLCSLLTLVSSCASQIKVEKTNPLIENQVIATNNFKDLVLAINPSNFLDDRNEKLINPYYEQVFNGSRREGKL